MEDGACSEIGQGALLNVEEEPRRGARPALTQPQLMVVLIVKGMPKNLEPVTPTFAQLMEDGACSEIGQGVRLNGEEEPRPGARPALTQPLLLVVLIVKEMPRKLAPVTSTLALLKLKISAAGKIQAPGLYRH